MIKFYVVWFTFLDKGDLRPVITLVADTNFEDAKTKAINGFSCVENLYIAGGFENFDDAMDFLNKEGER